MAYRKAPPEGADDFWTSVLVTHLNELETGGNSPPKRGKKVAAIPGKSITLGDLEKKKAPFSTNRKKRKRQLSSSSEEDHFANDAATPGDEVVDLTGDYVLLQSTDITNDLLLENETIEENETTEQDENELILDTDVVENETVFLLTDTQGNFENTTEIHPSIKLKKVASENMDCIVVNNFIKTMDSIPTSCVQLAKEQIIKYSDPKYNINDLKTGDCETMLLNQTIYYLNKSKSKWISVGLYYPFEFASVVKIFGRSKQYVIFKEEEWIQFHEQRENINKYFQTFDTMWKPRQIGSKTLTFEMIEEKKILKIEDMSGNEVYLGWESVSEVWSLESVLRYRLSYSSGSNFKYFYEDVIRAVAEMSGDVKINIYNIINRLSEKSDDVCCMLEVLLLMPEKHYLMYNLKRRIQDKKYSLLKKMWMLYAQEHWTKCYDLKSAVERLYEELGALEFDADHEAIYGMERYYTVQQCEELRDKYKIGRKVCRKFLQGRTCSQCLVKRISEIGLRHFLDTVNKYIKDCSDSSSSSDEEVFKAVEQNGEETTEEEEESKKSESESVTKLV
ncbi:hypothetical protein FQA39_LY18288 [Lamprigera yunnana]|nr:hypothetical protein FQA39_LY18288 [Lamprigera yunnana]